MLKLSQFGADNAPAFPAPVAQWIRVSGFYPFGRGFESLPGRQIFVRLTDTAIDFSSVLCYNDKELISKFMADVAQLVRASVCGTEGRGFESHHSPQNYQ